LIKKIKTNLSLMINTSVELFYHFLVSEPLS
jgi:hypothetical protein